MLKSPTLSCLNSGPFTYSRIGRRSVRYRSIGLGYMNHGLLALATLRGWRLHLAEMNVSEGQFEDMVPGGV